MTIYYDVSIYYFPKYIARNHGSLWFPASGKQITFREALTSREIFRKKFQFECNLNQYLRYRFYLRFLFKSFCETDFANYPSGFILSSCRYCRNIKEKRYRDHLFIQYVIFQKSNISYSYCAYQGARNDTLSVNFAVVLMVSFEIDF